MEPRRARRKGRRLCRPRSRKAATRRPPLCSFAFFAAWRPLAPTQRQFCPINEAVRHFHRPAFWGVFHGNFFHGGNPVQKSLIYGQADCGIFPWFSWRMTRMEKCRRKAQPGVWLPFLISMMEAICSFFGPCAPLSPGGYLEVSAPPGSPGFHDGNGFSHPERMLFFSP